MIERELTTSHLITCDPNIVSGTPVFTGTRVPIKNLLDYLKGNHNLDEFLEDFPSVGKEQAKEVLELAKYLLVEAAQGKWKYRYDDHNLITQGVLAMQAKALITRNPNILGGTPVFAGTRVPVKILFDYLEGGDSLDVFLDHFPTVKRAQAVKLLEALKDLTLSQTVVLQPKWGFCLMNACRAL